MSQPIVLKAAAASKPATCIILHGLGDSGHGWQPVAKMLQKNLKHIKFVLPHAPVQPVTLNGGYKMPSWHDIKSLHSIDAEDFKGLEESRKYVESLIAEEVKAGTPSNRIVVGGFSQGAGLSVYTGFQSKHPLAGVVCLSGYIPHKGDFAKLISEENKQTACLICHGDADEVVIPKAGDRVNSVLKGAGIPVTYKTYRGMGHSSCPEEIADINEFLKKVLPE